MGKLKNKYCSLILCAGYGSRMKSMGAKVHKSLIKINEKTILENVIISLADAGIKDHVVAVGYKNKSIKKVLNQYKDLNFKFINIKEYKTRGSSFSLFKASKYCLEYKKILMIHADIFFDTKLLTKVIETKRSNVLGFVKKNYKTIKNKGFIIKFNKKNKISKLDFKKNFDEKINNEITCINKFSNRKLKKIRESLKKYFYNENTKQTWEIPFNQFIQKNNEEFYAAGLKNKFWFNINTKRELNHAKKFCLNKLNIKKFF